MTALLARALEGVDRLFQTRAGHGLAPSCSYGVFTRDGLIHTGATGEVAGRTPTPDTIYRIASCTKSFTATALLALRDEGAVTLDDPITEYVPAFAEVSLPTVDSPIPTLRMLLTMSGGFPTDDPWGDRQESISHDDLDALLSRGLTFDSVPGTRFAYSNLGYALLGRVIEVAAGTGYREVVEGRILRPLGLTSTTFTAPQGADERLAIGHRRLDEEWQPLPFSGPGGFSSIGGLFSTVNDLSRWARWLSSAFEPAGAGGAGGGGGGAPGDLDGILSRASRRELQQAYRTWTPLPAHPTGYGFGLVVSEETELGTVVAHSGGYPGFSAHMRWHPASGIGLVAFENATYAQVSVPTTTALHGLLREVEAAPVPHVRPETAAARREVEKLVAGADAPASLLSENVELDIPLASRRAQWAEAVGAVGGLVERPPRGDAARVDTSVAIDPSLAIDPEAGEESQSPSHLVWRMPGERGSLRVEIRLTPERPPRVQTLTVRPEPFR